MRTRTIALRRLRMLEGQWRTTGRMLCGDHAGKRFAGSDRYRWLPGGMFLQHTWNVRMPDGIHRGLEILGFDPDAGVVFAHAYDADGSLTSSQLGFHGNAFRISGGALAFEGRVSATGDSIAGTWSAAEDGTPVMDVQLRRRGAAT